MKMIFSVFGGPGQNLRSIVGEFRFLMLIVKHSRFILHLYNIVVGAVLPWLLFSDGIMFMLVKIPTTRLRPQTRFWAAVEAIKSSGGRISFGTEVHPKQCHEISNWGTQPQPKARQQLSIPTFARPAKYRVC